MDTLDFIHVKHQNALLICQRAELKEEARVLLRNNTTTAQYVSQLLEKKLYSDAVRFLAHALQKREASLWACLCARHSLPSLTSHEEMRALELAEAWIQNPNEDTRKLTMPAAVANAFKNPASWAAVAVFWSGNPASMRHETTPRHDDFSAKAVIMAVTMAVSHYDKDKTTNNYPFFLQQGIDIACGVITI